jgi:hypothetical protein
MAKQRRTNSAVAGISALRNAIKQVGQSERAKVDQNLSEEEKTVIVNNAMDSVDNAMDIIGDSNITTVLENTDDSIEMQHEMAEMAEEAEAVGEPPAEAEQTDEADETDEAEQTDEPKAEQVDEPEA